MAGALAKAEAEAMEERIIKKVQSKVDEQAEADARALSVVNQILQSETDKDLPREAEIDEVIAKASPMVKVVVFDQAQMFRQKYWRDVNTKHKMFLIIPIFKALISCDINKEYHRNHAQLGYALKDKPNPNYVSAEAELSKAIEIRNRIGKKGEWRLYEINRAYCRIMINNSQNKEVFSKEDIMNDIEIAKQRKEIKDVILKENVFATWLQNNGV